MIKGSYVELPPVFWSRVVPSISLSPFYSWYLKFLQQTLQLRFLSTNSSINDLN
jgi:hypothetical protein